jgi:hypothetical protein
MQKEMFATPMRISATYWDFFQFPKYFDANQQARSVYSSWKGYLKKK